MSAPDAITVPEDVVLALAPGNAPTITVPDGSELIVITKDCFSNAITSTEQLFSSVGWELINPATGPIAIEGARPGDTLKVEILEIQTADEGTMTTHPEFGVLPGTVDERTRKVPVRDGHVEFDQHVRFPVDPMIGVIGTAPADAEIPTGTPGDHGGNMDCKEIAAGATLYLPVEVEGANLAIGDVHAAMGDGEVAVCGLEIAATVRVRVSVVPGRPLPLPFLVTDSAVMALASRDALSAAVTEATRMMRDWLAEHSPLDATDALMLLSLVGDLRICQIVDPMVTARMELRRDAVEAYALPLP